MGMLVEYAAVLDTKKVLRAVHSTVMTKGLLSSEVGGTFCLTFITALFCTMEYTMKPESKQFSIRRPAYYPTVGEKIMSTKDPLEARKLSKCIVKNEMWRRIEEEVITEICVCAALHDNAYFHELINTGDAMLIEAVRGDFEWGSGLGYRETMSTVIDKIPGSNKMGNILMLVRRRLFSSQVQGSCQSEAEQLSSPTQMSPNRDEIGQVNLSQAVHSNTLNRHHHTAPSPKTLEQDSSSPQDNPIINSSMVLKTARTRLLRVSILTIHQQL